MKVDRRFIIYYLFCLLDEHRLFIWQPRLHLISLLLLRRYPIQSPRPGCYGDREDSPGVRNYGIRSPDELFDVYCFAKQFQGKSWELKLGFSQAWVH